MLQGYVAARSARSGRVPCIAHARNKRRLIYANDSVRQANERKLPCRIDDHAVSRGKLLRYGAGGAAAVALGAVPGVARGARRAAAATPKRGGTLKFARSIAPTQLDPSNSIIAGDVYTLDKIFEPL